MSVKYGFFDVDCLELNERGNGLGYRPRVSPIVPRLEKLYALAKSKGYPLVFTTCCSGQMLDDDSLEDVLVVPLETENEEWLSNLNQYEIFNMRKKAYGDPKLNASCRAFDMFQDNGNAVQLLKALDVDTWVLFGNGFDLCVGSAVKGILKAGLPLLLIEDLRISSAGGTPESECATLAAMKEMGANFIYYEEFLAQENWK